MIKWNSNFNIENSSIQLATAMIKILSFNNNESECNVDLLITDEDQTYTVKQTVVTISGNYTDIDSVYLEVVKLFENAELVAV